MSLFRVLNHPAPSSPCPILAGLVPFTRPLQMPTIPPHSYAQKSCDPWNQRTAHRGCGPHRDETNPTHDPACSTFLLSHSTRITPQVYWEPQSEPNCHVQAYNMLRGEKCLPSNYLQPNETHDPTLSSLRLHTTRTLPQLYREPQSGLNCLVHAYNMLRGERRLTADELHSHTCNNLQLDAIYLHLVSLDPTDLCAARGDFSFHCLNHYCLTTQNTTFIGERTVYFTPVEVIFDALSKHGHRGLLLTASNSGANGHFTAIRRHANG
jgi:hypothetical protein